MTYDDTREPSDGPPPRTVHPWTWVTGHQIIGREQGGPRVFCKCGERRGPADDPKQWAQAHIENAWPILIERGADESREDFLRRLSTAYAEAVEVLQADERAGINKPIPPGGEYPVITEEISRADDRVEVLGHQMQLATRALP